MSIILCMEVYLLYYVWEKIMSIILCMEICLSYFVWKHMFCIMYGNNSYYHPMYGNVSIILLGKYVCHTIMELCLLYYLWKYIYHTYYRKD